LIHARSIQILDKIGVLAFLTNVPRGGIEEIPSAGRIYIQRGAAGGFARRWFGAGDRAV
jgi:hypothetical protein